MLHLIFLVFAFVLLALAAFSVPPGGRIQLGWLGLALFVLSFLLTSPLIK
jgi:hypothetical protein